MKPIGEIWNHDKDTQIGRPFLPTDRDTRDAYKPCKLLLRPHEEGKSPVDVGLPPIVAQGGIAKIDLLQILWEGHLEGVSH